MASNPRSSSTEMVLPPEAQELIRREEKDNSAVKGLAIMAVCLAYAFTLFFLASIAHAVCFIFKLRPANDSVSQSSDESDSTTEQAERRTSIYYFKQLYIVHRQG